MDYASAIGKIVPGTFVPDIGAGTDVPNVAPIPGGPAPAGGEAQGGTSFKDTVKALMSDVNDKLNTSDQNMRDLASGKTNDLQKVATSVEEANLALNFAMSMRTKLLEAYQEIQRTQI